MWTRIEDDTGGGHSLTGFHINLWQCGERECGALLHELFHLQPDACSSYGRTFSFTGHKDFESATLAPRQHYYGNHDLLTREQQMRAIAREHTIPLEEWAQKRACFTHQPEPMDRHERALMLPEALCGFHLLPSRIERKDAEALARWAHSLEGLSEREPQARDFPVSLAADLAAACCAPTLWSRALLNLKSGPPQAEFKQSARGRASLALIDEGLSLLAQSEAMPVSEAKSILHFHLPAPGLPGLVDAGLPRLCASLALKACSPQELNELTRSLMQGAQAAPGDDPKLSSSARLAVSLIEQAMLEREAPRLPAKATPRI